MGAYHILKNHEMSGDSAKITEKGAKAQKLILCPMKAVLPVRGVI